MHVNPAVILGCTDCHGGDAHVAKPQAAEAKDPAYRAAVERAHVLPKYPAAWKYPSSANPEDSYTLLNREAPEYVRFVNPGDYRVARESCGACHLRIIQATERSLMSTSAMLWGGGFVQQRDPALQALPAGRGLHRQERGRDARRIRSRRRRR